ncbi:MAG: hypothetical protein F4103_13030 [Boseongicola sp. SB0673_bin_14]|nr:hypothetical protein [Acidimicrobiaceae bacterium]MYI69616.1 hypothetical protein [Boseongicola sp. SB0673_bin_14]
MLSQDLKNAVRQAEVRLGQGKLTPEFMVVFLGCVESIADALSEHERHARIRGVVELMEALPDNVVELRPRCPAQPDEEEKP